MVRMIRFSNNEINITTPGIDELIAALKSEEGVFWLDLVETPYETAYAIMDGVFNFHPLAIEDALEDTHVPKLDDWVDYLYIVLHDFQIDFEKKAPLSTSELDIFIGKRWLVTYQKKRIPAIDLVWETTQRNDRTLRRGIGYVFYRIADEMVLTYMPAVDQISDVVDEMEDVVFRNPQQTLLEQIFTLKRSMLHIRRIMTPQREVLNKLARNDYDVIDEGNLVLYRDVSDQLVQLYEITEGLRDLIGGVLETYLSVVNNRMNEIVKALTIITTLFMPITFLTGFFGMNFFAPAINLSGWTGRTALFITMGLIFSMPLMMLLYMRKRHWM